MSIGTGKEERGNESYCREFREMEYGIREGNDGAQEEGGDGEIEEFTGEREGGSKEVYR